jgi:hypothetical protein
MTPALADAQNGQCLYCLRKVSAGHIDRFVPWSRYPREPQRRHLSKTQC